MPRDSETTTELLTLPQAAAAIGVGLKSIYRAAKSGQFPTYYAGTSWPRVRLTDLRRWIRSTRVAPTPSAVAVADAMAQRSAEREARAAERSTARNTGS